VTPPDLEDGVVRAAGGVLLRPGVDGEPEVLLVHRPRYDDWSLPKGKCDPGESYEDCARREVEEETGITAELGDPLPEVRYRDQKGRPKLVRYWVMRPASEPGPFEPNDEVDEVAWLSLAKAEEQLSYDHDRGLLATLRRLT
jgi:8-oxo-dGTP diphosphatase